MAVGLVYSTTLLGIYVVGSDIQGEIYASRNTLFNGIDFANTNSPSVVSVVFAPWLSQVLNIDIIWVYKAILPLFLMVVPVFLYLAFKEQIGSKMAYFASLFFMVMPSYSMEIATIGKSMVAEFFYALMILAMVSKWNWYTKGLVMTLCAVLAIVSHYTIGIIVLVNLIAILAVRIVTNWTKWKLFIVKRVSLYLLPLILVLTMGSFYLVYNQMSGGWINHLVSNITTGYIVKVVDIGDMAIKKVTENKAISSKVIGTAPAIETLEPSYLYQQTYLTQVGLGLDFFKQPIEGKVFRVIQYLTQALIILGALYLLFKRRYEFTAEFIAGIGCSFALLFACMFLPGFSSLINMSRFYHISLFFIAPMLIIGIDCVGNVWRKK
jgi:uncharacterized membrane protein